jgi:nitrogen fixation protein FixH
MTKPQAARPFTGYHMTAILVAFFGVIIVVNFTMARLASKTFGGEVVENSYVASQHFNHWLDEAAREKALGWTAAVSRTPDGRVALGLGGVPQGNAEVSAVARHPLGVMPQQPLTFEAAGKDRFVSTRAIPQGRWRLRIEVKLDGKAFSTEQDLP